MSEAKFICQCGTRFKLGLDLASGRVTTTPVCAGCKADATAAAAVWLDFLAGRPLPVALAAIRPLKEVRVQCPCGWKLKFDMELSEEALPVNIVCGDCKADLNAAALAAIAAIRPAVSGAPASGPAQGEKPAGSETGAPATGSPLTPALSPSAGAREDNLQGGAPIASSPAKAAGAVPGAPVAKPPPSATAPSAKSAPAASPPAKATGSPMGKPSAPASKPAPTPAKSLSRPPAYRGAAAEPSAARAMAGAAGGAVIGGVVWWLVAMISGHGLGFLALLVGGLGGLGARQFGRGATQTSALMAGVIAAGVIGACLWPVSAAGLRSYTKRIAAGSYEAQMRIAQEAVKAKTDADIQMILMRGSAMTMGGPMTGMGGAAPKNLEEWKAKELPRLREMAEGKVSRSAFESEAAKKALTGISFSDRMESGIGIFGLLMMVLSPLAASAIVARE